MTGAIPYTQQEIQELIAPLFSRHDPKGIYLANHSLGRPLDATQTHIDDFLTHWYGDLDGAWEPWLRALEAFQSKVKGLLHLPDPGHVVMKTSAGQGLRAVLNSFPPGKKIRVLTTSMEFDSIDFILRTYADQGIADVTFLEPAGHEGCVSLFSGLDLASALEPGTDLVVASLVNFTTGQILPGAEALVEAAHQNGTAVLFDTYHSFGVVDLPWTGADFAIGGSYKYVHGGPGACWLAIGPQVAYANEWQTRDTGWFAKKELFGYERDAERADGPRAWWESTPPVIEAYQALAGLEYLERFEVARLRATNLFQQKQLRAEFRRHGLPVFDPVDPNQFGAFSLLPASNHKEVVDQLKSQGIRVDSRNGFVRFGPHPLNTQEEFERVALTLEGVRLG